MIKDHKTRDGIYVTFNEPDICPICSHAIEPVLLSSRIHEFGETNSTIFTVFFECTFCKKSFISSYSLKLDQHNSIGYYYKEIKFLYSAPSHFQNQEFEDCINSVSPSFVKIYNQALEAEHYSLDEIAGIGYRKALEFLIKDYCIFKNPLEIDNISKKPLAQCIENYIDDDRLKKTAKASAWLGNDETHYIKKFEDKDINDLKRFINTTVYFILYNMNVDEADEILNSP